MNVGVMALYAFIWRLCVDFMPIAKNEEHFRNWVDVYLFYSNVKKEGVKLFEAA